MNTETNRNLKLEKSGPYKVN